MPAKRIVSQPRPDPVHRTVRLRLSPGNRETAYRLAGTAGACRWVWNHFLARQQWRYRPWCAYRIGPCPTVSFFGLGKEFTALRRDPGHDWLRQYGHKEVKYVLKYLADAYRTFLSGRRGCPRFKARHRHRGGFTIPSHVTIRDSCLRVPKAGWCRLRGRNSYAGCHPLQARIRQEGTPARPKWYVYLTCAVPATQVNSGAHTGITGLDRNVGQCTDSTGTIYRMTDTARLDARIRCKQR